MKIDPALQKNIVDNFHQLYYYSDHTWGEGHTKWMGVECHQNPLDMWILQEIIFENRPTVIIETGTYKGGSALFFAHMMDIANIPGVVFTVDVGNRCNVDHPKIITYTGEKSTSFEFLNIIKDYLKGGDYKVMVFLDSDHSTENVLEEMRSFAPFVTPGQYMVVCDSNIGGNPVQNGYVQGPGPMAAIEQFMKENNEFEVDRNCERFYFTFHPSGFLRRRV